MTISTRIQREVDAIKRDREWKKYDGHSLDASIDRMEEYPSIPERVRSLYYKLWRGKEAAVEFPYKVKNFIHRGRHGWATPDTWNGDYTLAKQLGGFFTEFRRVNIAYPCDTTEEEWDNTLKEIADGFIAYSDWQDWDEANLFDRHGDIDAQLKEKDERFQAAHEKVKRSCQLMGENWPGFWW